MHARSLRTETSEWTLSCPLMTYGRDAFVGFIGGRLGLAVVVHCCSFLAPRLLPGALLRSESSDGHDGPHEGVKVGDADP